MEHSSEGCHNIVSPQYSRKHSLLPGTCKSLYLYILNCIPEYTESCHSWHHNLNEKKISNKLRRRALTSVYALEITCYGTITQKVEKPYTKLPVPGWNLNSLMDLGH